MKFNHNFQAMNLFDNIRDSINPISRWSTKEPQELDLDQINRINNLNQYQSTDESVFETLSMSLEAYISQGEESLIPMIRNDFVTGIKLNTNKSYQFNSNSKSNSKNRQLNYYSSQLNLSKNFTKKFSKDLSKDLTMTSSTQLNNHQKIQNDITNQEIALLRLNRPKLQRNRHRSSSNLNSKSKPSNLNSHNPNETKKPSVTYKSLPQHTMDDSDEEETLPKLPSYIHRKSPSDTSLPELDHASISTDSNFNSNSSSDYHHSIYDSQVIYTDPLIPKLLKDNNLSLKNLDDDQLQRYFATYNTSNFDSHSSKKLSPWAVPPTSPTSSIKSKHKANPSTTTTNSATSSMMKIRQLDNLPFRQRSQSVPNWLHSLKQSVSSRFDKIRPPSNANTSNSNVPSVDRANFKRSGSF